MHNKTIVGFIFRKISRIIKPSVEKLVQWQEIATRTMRSDRERISALQQIRDVFCAPYHNSHK